MCRQITSLFALACPLLVSCQEASLPEDFGSQAFWADPDPSQAARDLGHTPRVLTEDERAPAGPITLVDVTDDAGLANAYGGGNTHGVGVAFADLSGDDWPDIFVANGRGNYSGVVFPSLVYLNRGDGTFTDVTQESGVADILAGRDLYSVAAGDYDNDGDVDLYLGAQPTDVLLANCGQSGSVCFEDATAAAGAGGPPSDPELVGNGKSKIAVFGDHDRDGDLDILSASSTLPAPFAYLLQNNGDGTFTDVSAATGVRADPSGNPCAVLFSDYDNDSDPDIWIWNDRGGHILLRNQDGAAFEDVTGSSGLAAVEISHPMGIDAADMDHDGDLDYYISNDGNNPLLRNNGDGTFVDITALAGTGGEFGWGLGFEDLDNDTFPDIFVAQEDARPHLVFRNLGQAPPAFERIEVEHAPVIDPGNAHNVAVAFADYDRDGRTDVLVATTDGSRLSLFRNQTEVGTRRYLHVVVRPRSGPENSTGISARVGVKTGDLVQFRDLTGGSSRASQNQLSVRFGLGQVTGADWVVALWPTGAQTVFTRVPGDRTVVLTAP